MLQSTAKHLDIEYNLLLLVYKHVHVSVLSIVGNCKKEAFVYLSIQEKYYISRIFSSIMNLMGLW